MKAILLMFDSLNRHMLPPYGGKGVHAPNFSRLAERTVAFDNSYVASMPCMPARREIHTGRYNFLHRSWGPVEPYDDSMPELLKQKGVYTHLATDHQHYWEDGGATYHNRYSSYELIRGQEGDAWKGHVEDPPDPPRLGQSWRQDRVNRTYFKNEADFPQAKTFAAGLEFLRKNAAQDRWFLQLETFDPHEPFFAPQKYRDLCPHTYDGPHFDWPLYQMVKETPEQVQHLRYEYAALMSMCDAYLGKVLDTMDELDLWKDTLLIVGTDHGFLLGEHDWWAKIQMPFWQEIAHTPLFVWDPRCGKKSERRQSLVQIVDWAPTLLEYFGIERPPDMQGRVLREAIASDQAVREAGLFGVFGGHVNVTDGRHVYMRAPAQATNAPLNEYTLMPTHMRSRFSPEELRRAELSGPQPFSKGCPLLRMPGRSWNKAHEFGTLLYDVQTDPQQRQPLHDPAVEARMLGHLTRLMRENHAPPEQFERLGLPA